MEKTIKTTEQWITQHLPEEVSKRAIRNIKALKSDPVSYLKFEKSSVHEALHGAFVWDASPEKHNYWSAIAGRALKGEFDKPINPDPEKQLREPWNDEELAILRKLFPQNDNEAIGRLINRTSSAVSNKARRLKLQKSKEYLRAHPPVTFRPLSFWARLGNFLFG